MAFISAANTVIDNNTAIFHTSFEKVAGTTQSTEVKIKASDGSVDDWFGRTVSVGSGRIVIGAGQQDPGGTFQAGAAYIFDLNGTQLAKIVASDLAASDQFGWSVSVGSGRIVVGAFRDDDTASNSGSAYIFNLNGTQIAKIKDPSPTADDQFGQAVAVGSGRIVVGSPGDDDSATDAGAAFIFDLNGTQIAKIKASDGAASDNFGSSVAIGCGRIVVGAYGDDDVPSESGSAYIYDLNGTQLNKLTAPDPANNDQFGYSVAVGCGRIIIGSRFDDDVASESGSAYIYDLNGNFLRKITAPDPAASDFFGFSVAVGSGRIVVGAYGDDDSGSSSGSMYIYDLNGTYLSKIKASDGVASDFFGFSVAVGSGRIVAGAYGDDDLGSTSGSAYIYKLPETSDTYYENVLDTFRY